MYRINFTTLSLLLVLGMNGLMSEPTQNADGSIKGLYEYLLQREYAAPVSYADHQIKRKAVRSPSLRLRFGRRSDPDMPVQPEEEDSMPAARTIRAPQLRLRFGRSDPLWKSLDQAALLEEKRAPSQRLRWGRSEPGSFNENAFRQGAPGSDELNRDPALRLRWGRESGEDDFESDDALTNRLYRDSMGQLRLEHELGMNSFTEDKRAPSQRLRWGRSDPLLSPDNTMQEDKRAPSQRLRWGRSDPLLSNDDTILEEEKRAPSQRLRWGRSGGLFTSSDVMQQKAIRAPQLRLRFGRSDPAWASFNEHHPEEKREAAVTERTVDSEEHTAASEETGSSNMDEK